MMKHEFEALAGYEVSAEDYTKIIEPMYMATDLSKEDFVKVVSKQRFALKPLKKMERMMKKIAAYLEENCTHFTDYDAVDELRALAEEYAGRIGAKGHIINYADKWSCYYPKSIEFYGHSYNTMAIITF